MSHPFSLSLPSANNPFLFLSFHFLSPFHATSPYPSFSLSSTLSLLLFLFLSLPSSFSLPYFLSFSFFVSSYPKPPPSPSRFSLPLLLLLRLLATISTTSTRVPFPSLPPPPALPNSLNRPLPLEHPTSPAPHQLRRLDRLSLDHHKPRLLPATISTSAAASHTTRHNRSEHRPQTPYTPPQHHVPAQPRASTTATNAAPHPTNAIPLSFSSNATANNRAPPHLTSLSPRRPTNTHTTTRRHFKSLMVPRRSPVIRSLSPLFSATSSSFPSQPPLTAVGGKNYQPRQSIVCVRL